MSNDKFDPVAFVEARTAFPFDHDTIRALAAEAAKQQARRDAEICRAMDGEDCFAEAIACAQAIEREANL